MHELRAGVNDLPSFATIIRLYRTTSAMFLGHGYQPRRHGAQTRSAHNHLLIERDSGGASRGASIEALVTTCPRGGHFYAFF